MYFGMKFLWVLAVWGVNEVLSYMNYNIPKTNIRKRYLFDFDTTAEYRVMVPRQSKRIVLELYDNNPMFAPNVEPEIPSFPSLYEWLYGSLSDLSARSYGHNVPYPFYQPYSQQRSTLQKKNTQPYKVEMDRNMPHIILNSTSEILPQQRGKTEENKKVEIQKESNDEEKAAQPSFRVNTVASSQNVRGNKNSISSFLPFITRDFHNRRVSNGYYQYEPKNNLETEYLSRLFLKQNNRVASPGTKILCNNTHKISTNYNKEGNSYTSNEKETDSFEEEEPSKST